MDFRIPGVGNGGGLAGKIAQGSSIIYDAASEFVVDPYTAYRNLTAQVKRIVAPHIVVPIGGGDGATPPSPGISSEESVLVRDIAARLGGQEYSREVALYILERARCHWFSVGEREHAVRYALTADAICDESVLFNYYETFERVNNGHTLFTECRPPFAFPMDHPGLSLMAFMRDLARAMSLYELSFDKELFRVGSPYRICRFAQNHAEGLIGLLEGERVKSFQLSEELVDVLSPIQSCVTDLLQKCEARLGELRSD